MGKIFPYKLISKLFWLFKQNFLKNKNKFNNLCLQIRLLNSRDMRPQLLKVSAGPSCSFSVRQDRVPYVNNRWPYHPEIELIYFREGTGTQFIGDNIEAFRSGDVGLVGTNLPHYWSFDDRQLNPAFAQ